MGDPTPHFRFWTLFPILFPFIFHVKAYFDSHFSFSFYVLINLCETLIWPLSYKIVIEVCD